MSITLNNDAKDMLPDVIALLRGGDAIVDKACAVWNRLATAKADHETAMDHVAVTLLSAFIAGAKEVKHKSVSWTYLASIAADAGWTFVEFRKHFQRAHKELVGKNLNLGRFDPANAKGSDPAPFAGRRGTAKAEKFVSKKAADPVARVISAIEREIKAVKPGTKMHTRLSAILESAKSVA